MHKPAASCHQGSAGDLDETVSTHPKVKIVNNAYNKHDSMGQRTTSKPQTAVPFSPLRRSILIGLGIINAGWLGACAIKPAVELPHAARPSGRTAAGFQLDNRGTVSAQQLDDAVTSAFPLFNSAAVLPGFDASTQGASNAVDLYRITTQTTVPETGEILDVTGLLALPAGHTGELPVVSWQHGTILSFDQVPSNLTKLATPGTTLSDEADSLETLFNIHRFAAQGFAVIAADYVGKGPLRDGRGEGYSVKGVTTQTCLDILNAGLAALRSLDVQPTELFLHGWSQGGLNTQWLHQALRNDGVDIRATAVASPFNDLLEAWLFWTENKTFPLPAGSSTYPEIPSWVALCMIIALGSYELQYGIDGLIESAVRPEYREMARKYWNDYQVDASGATPLPTSQTVLVKDIFETSTDERNQQFLEHVVANDASSWSYDRPIRFHYGLADEAIHPAMVTRLLNTDNPFMHGVPIAGGNHRAAFLAGLYGDASTLADNDNALSWFQSLRADRS